MEGEACAIGGTVLGINRWTCSSFSTKDLGSISYEMSLLQGRKSQRFSFLPEVRSPDRRNGNLPHRSDVASYQALKNQKTEALEYLDKAMNCGWRDWPFFEGSAPITIERFLDVLLRV